MSMLRKACLVQSMKWKRSSLRRSSTARFLKASGSSPPYSTASEWSTISCTGTTGLTLDGSPPLSAMASRRPDRPARSGPGCHDRPRAPDTREVQVAAALDQLLERVRQLRRLAAASGFRQHARGVRQTVIGAGRDGLDGGARIKVVQAGAQGLAIGFVHHASVRRRLPWAICCSMLRRDARCGGASGVQPARHRGRRWRRESVVFGKGLPGAVGRGRVLDTVHARELVELVAQHANSIWLPLPLTMR